MSRTQIAKEQKQLYFDPLRIRPFADQPREHFDNDEMICLELSIKAKGQVRPGLIREVRDDRDHDFELIDGQRRWHACVSLKVPFMAIVGEPQDIEDQFELSLISNFHGADHTPMEISRAIDRLQVAGKTIGYIAITVFGKSIPWVQQYQRYVSLVPELQKLLGPPTPEPDRIALTLATTIARLAKKDQLTAWATIQRKKLSAQAAIDHVKKSLVSQGKLEPRPMIPSDHIRNIARVTTKAQNDLKTLIQRLTPETTTAVVTLLERQNRANRLRNSIASLIETAQALSARLTDTSVRKDPSSEKKLAEEFVYSRPYQCSKCRKSTRFKKLRDADPAKGFWTCLVSGCQIRISHVSIPVQRDYQP